MTGMIDFLRRYQAMRQAQKEYFASPSQRRLQHAKELEFRLDQQATQLLKELGADKPKEPKQGTLL